MIFSTLLILYSAHAADIRMVTPSNLRHLTTTARAEVLEQVAKVLTDIERKPSAPHCTRAGWVFESSACDLPILHNGCEPFEIRCAAWTGRAGCVKQSPVGECFRARTEGERQISLDYFNAPSTALNWREIWKMVRAKCAADGCRELQKAIPPPQAHHTYLEKIWEFIVPSVAAEECGLEPQHRFFVKPDGHRIYLLFGIHQEETEGAGDAPIDQALVDAKGDANVIKDFLKVRIESGNNEDMIKQNQITKTLAEQGKLDWVALESLPTNFGAATLDQWRLSTDHYKSELQKLGIPNASIEDYFSYAWGPTLYATMKAEPWQKKLQIVPFDDDPIKIEQSRVLDEIRTLSSADMPAADALRIRDFLDRKIDQGESLSDAEASTFLKSFKGKSTAKLKMFIDKTRHFVALREKRDALTVRNILGRPGNGLLNLGKAHRARILKELAASCGSPTKPAVESPATTR